MATHSRILAWKIPWTEEPGGQSQTQWSDLAHIGIALVYNIICFMNTTLFFDFSASYIACLLPNI